MAIVSGSTTDGYVYKYVSDTWANVRDATSGTANSTSGYSATAIKVLHSGGRGGNTYYVGRSFFAFDTSGIAAAPSSATLNLYGYSGTTADIIVVKATKPDLSTGIAAADFDAITGFSAGSSMSGNVTDYSSEVTTWSTGAYNSITLNAAALSDIGSGGVLAVCIVEYDHDYLNSAASSNNSYVNGLYYADQALTVYDPYLNYTPGGYGHDVLGVDSGNISKVIGVATADIDEVMGV